MKKEYNFSPFGIQSSLNLFGKIEVLFFKKGLPILFLFDEHHNNLNNCIDNNIENAKVLIANGNVKIIGVESHTGGREWNKDTQSYMEYEDSDKNYSNHIIGECTKFANELSKENKNMIQGVECEAFSNDLVNYKGNFPFIEIPINIERSKHFIRTLFELRQRTTCIGNLILNCGRDHNTHIEGWINNGEIDEITGIQANYIRINTIG